MQKKRLIILLLTGLLLTTPVYAQNDSDTTVGWWKNFVNWMTSGNDNLDPEYVWQSPNNWTVTIENDLYESGINLKTDGKLHYLHTPELNHKYTWNGNIQSSMSDEIALSVTWGALSAGWGFDVSTIDKNSRSSSNFFSFLDAGAGLSVSYNSIYNNINSTYHNLYTDSTVSLNTENPAHYKTLIVEAYNVMRKDKFAFNACYDGSYVQRRTGGSLLVYAKYIHGDFDLPTDEYNFVDFNNNVMGYTTNQFFLGGGYGINFVPYHRDPTEGFTGLRNLTIHAVVCPMLTLVNKLHYIEGSYDAASGQWKEVNDRGAAGQPDFNIAVRAALCYNIGRYALSGIFTYNKFNLVTTGIDFMDEETDYYESAFHFYDWQVMLVLNIRL